MEKESCVEKLKTCHLNVRKSPLSVLAWEVRDGAAGRLSFWEVLPGWQAAELLRVLQTHREREAASSLVSLVLYCLPQEPHLHILMET